MRSRNFIAHAKGLGLSTPCPQCTRPSLVWRGAAKEGISPSIYRFGFYLNLRLEVGGTYMLMCREFAKSCEESALAMIGHYYRARPEDTLWLYVWLRPMCDVSSLSIQAASPLHTRVLLRPAPGLCVCAGTTQRPAPFDDPNDNLRRCENGEFGLCGT